MTREKPLTTSEILDSVEAQIASLEGSLSNKEDALAWLKDFRLPLASLSANALIGLVQSRISGTTDAVLTDSMRKLSAAELVQVLHTNAQAFQQIADERVREVALIFQTKNRLTEIAAKYVMSAILKLAGFAI